MFIYAVTNDVNDKAYIGLHSGRDLRTRWATHLSLARTGSRSPIHAAIRKYGEQKFHIVSVWSGYITFANLKILEQYFIRCFQTKVPNGYNLTNGGDGTLGYRHSEEEKLRRAERMRQQNVSGNINHKGEKRSSETVRKISAIKTGMKYKPWSEEAHRNLSLARMGNKNSLGFKQSAETIAKSVAGHAGWKPSAEHHRRLVEGAIRHNMGRKLSEDTRRKMSLSQKARWAERKNADATTH